MPPRSLITAETVDEATVVRFSPGAFDYEPAWAIHRELSRVVRETAGRDIRLDLAHAPLLTTSALGMLVAVHNELKASGRRLTLIQVRPHLYDIFRATRLTDLFDVRPAPAGNILVVEDDAVTRDALKTVLEEKGYGVACAHDGRQALDRLGAAEPPALILLDLMMPGMDGWEFRREQERDPALASIPVVVVSGAGDVPAAAAALGVEDYLQKPVEFDQLLATVRHYC
jgi:anti-anti-sigma factor